MSKILNIESNMENKVKTDILTGLTSKRKYLDLLYHWNEEGSRLNDVKYEDCRWYYYHRHEKRLLHSILESIMNHLENHTMLVDLGCGNASKTRMFLDRLMLLGDNKIIYATVDISGDYLVKTTSKVSADYGNALEIRPFACDYIEALGTIRQFKEKKLFVWFGGALMNLSHKDQINLLKRMAHEMDADDRLLVTVDGTDLNKKRQIELAYLDPDGYTGRFHTNAIQGLNDKFVGNIDITKFEYKNNFVTKKDHHTCSYIEIWMEAIEQCEFHLGGLNLTLNFEKGERMYFHKDSEYSCKYTTEQIQHVCEEGSFQIVDSWHDEHIIVLLLRKQ